MGWNIVKGADPPSRGMDSSLSSFHSDMSIPNCRATCRSTQPWNGLFTLQLPLRYEYTQLPRHVISVGVCTKVTSRHQWFGILSKVPIHPVVEYSLHSPASTQI
ncbi:hypothetical protein J6590_010947 [Homalodisca vitripennis]|nr:hypothetical protein J6590_010947 [Homalodisca vitripennis]